MPNHDFMVERRMLAYITLLAGNLEATREFLVEYQDRLPFLPSFILHLNVSMKALELRCNYSGEELIKRLSITHSTLEVFNETH